MFQGFARGLVLAGLSGCALAACSSDATPENSGGAGTASGAATAGTATGGSSTSAGTGNSAGTASAGMASAGTASAGTAAGGAASAGSGNGGAGGSGGGASGGANGGGAGGGAATPTAVANITGLMGQTVTGTATFTQGATMTTLVLDLTACPNGAHASHLHLMKDCGDNGNAAGGHWLPNGEGIPDYTCAENKATLTFMKPTSMWTVGDGSATDVTKYSFMVHEMGGANGMNPGGRIGCGLVNNKQ